MPLFHSAGDLLNRNVCQCNTSTSSTSILKKFVFSVFDNSFKWERNNFFLRIFRVFWKHSANSLKYSKFKLNANEYFQCEHRIKMRMESNDRTCYSRKCEHSEYSKVYESYGRVYSWNCRWIAEVVCTHEWQPNQWTWPF